MTTRTKIFFILIILLCCNLSFSQTAFKGKDFWLGFMENIGTNPNPDIRVYISSKNATTGVVSIPGSAWSVSFITTPNSTTKISIPVSLALSKGTDIININGVHVTANDSIVVYALNALLFHSDASYILPTNKLGNDYILMSREEWINDEFLIAASEDSTVIEITPKSNTQGGKIKNIPYYIVLNQGQTYQERADSLLTGTSIRSINGKNFALFGGNKSGVVLCGATNHLYDQNYPVKYWGNCYLSAPLKTRGGDVFRILASKDSTELIINNGNPILLNKETFIDTLISIANCFTASKPISIAQYSVGNDCDIRPDNIGDPFFFMLTPNSRPIDYAIFNSFNYYSFLEHYVNIIIRTKFANNLLFDGVSIKDSFNVFTNFNEYSYAQLTLKEGLHIIECPDGFYAYAYGFGHVDGYGYSLGIGENQNIIINKDSINICLGDTITLTADSGKAYIWNTTDTTIAIIVSPTITTTYTVTVYYNGCPDSNSDEVIVTVSPMPIVNFSIHESPPYYEGQILHFLDQSTNGYEWEWQFGDGNYSTDINPKHSYSYEGLYSVQLIVCSQPSHKKCCDTLRIDDYLHILKEENIYIPTTFTPNNDNLNDILRVLSGNIKSLKFIIYNQWGLKVFESHNQSQGWDGTYNGYPQQEGSYIYFLEAITKDGQQINQQGTVSLIR